MIKLVDILFLGGICFAFLEQSVSQPPPHPPPSLSNSFSAKVSLYILSLSMHNSNNINFLEHQYICRIMAVTLVHNVNLKIKARLSQY